MDQGTAPTLFTVNEIELVYRNRANHLDRPQLTSPRSMYDVLLHAWDMNKIELVEQVMILLLDQGGRCLGVSCVASGSMNHCLLDPKIIFATALKARAAAITVAHNHPSGNLTPSKADYKMTEKLVEGGKLLDIEVWDHLIVSPRGFHSIASENGYILTSAPF